MFSNFKTEEGALLSMNFLGYHPIHMLFVKKPLWIYWLSKDLRVIDKTYAKPATLNPLTWKSYYSRERGMHVLELLTESLSIGDSVTFD